MNILERIILRIKFIFRGVFYFILFPSKVKYYKNTSFIVYSLGHSGSTTIYYNLLKYFPFTKVLHVHTLTNYWINKKSNINKNDRRIILSNKTYSHIKKNPNNTFYFITLVRSPIERPISSFFHNKKHLKLNINDKDELINEVKKNANYKKHLDWFSKDYNNFFNTDIYKTPFNKIEGYKIYRYNNFHSLVLKTNRINDQFKKAFFELTGINIKGDLNSYNKRSTTKSKLLYEYVKNNYRLNKEELNTLLSTKYVTHFFSDNEINQIYNKFKI